MNAPRPRPLISQARAEVVLQAWIPILCDTFEHSWNWVTAILDQDPERRRTLNPSTQAAMIYDRFVVLFLPMVFNTPNVRVKHVGRMLHVRIGEEILLRFKKLDRKLRSGNVPTLNQKAIYHNYLIQDVQDPATCVTFGYVPAIGESSPRLYLTCPKSFSENQWASPLGEADSRGTSLFSPAPLPPSLPLPQITPIRKPGQKQGKA